jgi:hypothetical protein
MALENWYNNVVDPALRARTEENMNMLARDLHYRIKKADPNHTKPSFKCIAVFLHKALDNGMLD